MIPQWVLLAGLGGLSSNLFHFLSRYVLRGKDDATSWAWFYEVLRTIFFSFAMIFDFSLQQNFYSFTLLILLGITEFASVYLYMKMHQYSHLSISTILSRTRLIWIPFIAFFFLGENLKLSEYVGILLLFLGVSATVAPHKLFMDKGAMYANIAAFVIAINVVLLKIAAPVASGSVILFFYSLPSVILFPLLMKDAKTRLLENTRKNVMPKMIAALASVGAGYFLILALKTGDVSKVNAIYQGMMVTGVLAGILFLKERHDILRKLLGTALAIVGIIFLTWGLDKT